jgi:uncharacterized protein YndB with AHSA1/START domain
VNEYYFVTNWFILAPIERVWDAISKADAWPSWWKSVQSVEILREGAEDGTGSVRRFTWKGRLPYTLAFEMETTKVQRPFRLEGKAKGELEGSGIWTLTERDKGTAIRYDWRVATTKSWMNFLAPIAKPLFNWNHDYVMREGGQGLARYLNTRIIL